MKEMKYGEGIKSEVLCIGEYRGVGYVIVNIGGSHPCAYVQSNKNYGDDCDIPSHCGITFFGSLYRWCDYVDNEEHKEMLRQNFIGWDYAHLSDYVWYCFVVEEDGSLGKKWSTQEIFDEVKIAIDWIKEVKSKT